MSNNLHDYDPSKLIDYFEKIKLPSGDEISTNPEIIKLELYKRGKKILKDSKKLKEEFIEYMMLKFESNPLSHIPLSLRILAIMEEGSTLMLTFINEIWEFMEKDDPVISESIIDAGMSKEDVKRLKIFFETCLKIVERDRECYKHKGGY